MRVIDGEVAASDPRVTWTCPDCGRVRVDERGQLVAVACTGPGRGIGEHPMSWMVATGRPPAPDLDPFGYVEPAAVVRRLGEELVRRIDLDAQQLRTLELGGPGWCSECGDPGRGAQLRTRRRASPPGMQRGAVAVTVLAQTVTGQVPSAPRRSAMPAGR